MGGSTHPYTALAKKGKGWVEIFLELDGIELPSRPDYYKGFVAVNHEVNLELYLFRLFEDTSSSSSSSEEEEESDREEEGAEEMDYEEDEGNGDTSSSSSSEEEEESDREEDGAEEMDYEEDEGNAEEVVGDSDASLG
jgi:hypothetical protein